MVRLWRRKRFKGVQILRLEPGDMLVFSSRKPLTSAMAAGLSEQLRDLFPDHKAVLAPEMDVSVVRGANAAPEGDSLETTP